MRTIASHNAVSEAERKLAVRSLYNRVAELKDTCWKAADLDALRAVIKTRARLRVIEA